jgi:hypothetical protein
MDVNKILVFNISLVIHHSSFIILIVSLPQTETEV